MEGLEKVKASTLAGSKCFEFYTDWAEKYDKVKFMVSRISATWAPWWVKSLATRLFVRQCIQYQKKDSFKGITSARFQSKSKYFQSKVLNKTQPSQQYESTKVVYPNVRSGADQRKHQNSAALAIVRGILPFTSEFPAQRGSNAKMFPFDDVIVGLIFLGVATPGLVQSYRCLVPARW